MPSYQFTMAVAFALPCFLMSARLFRAWRNPLSMDDGRWVSLGVGVFVMEFILLHAGVFLGSVGAKASTAAGTVASLGGLTLFYAVFAGAIAFSFKSASLFWSFVWLVLGRLGAIFIGAAESDGTLMIAHSFVGIVIYMIMVIASVVLPIPQYGITPELAMRFRTPGATGTWVDEPHRAIGAATVYFFVLGVVELAVMTWIDPATIGRVVR